MSVLVKVGDVLTRYAAVLIVALSVWAYFMPGLFSWMTGYTSLFLGVIMFGMGLTIRAADFRVVFTHPKEVLLGACLQYTVMPLAAWVLVHALSLPTDIALGVVLVACCPGGTASNVVTYIARGDVALSVGMTIVSTLLAPFVTPLLVYALAGSWVEVSIASMFVSVVQVVLVPVLLGIAINALAGERIQRITPITPVISALGIALIVAGIIAANADKLLASGVTVFACVVVHNAIGLAAGYGIARAFRLDYAKVSAVAIEVGLQNSGLAVSLATANFAANPLATLPGAVFSMWQNIAGSVFAGLRARRAPAQASVACSGDDAADGAEQLG